MDNKHLKRILLLVVLVTQILSVGCASNEQTMVQVSDLMDYAEKKAVLDLEERRITKKEEFDKMYANDLYLEDLDEARSELKEKYIEEISNKLKSKTSYPFFIKDELEFYNKSIKDYRDGNITYEQIMSDTGEHIRKAKFEIYYFYKPEGHKVSTDGINEVLSALWKKHLDEGVIETRFIWYSFDEELLKSNTLGEISSEDYPFVYLSKNSTCFSVEQYNNYGETYSEDNSYSLDYIQERFVDSTNTKYNTEFVYIRDLLENNKSMGSLLVPVDNPELWFENYSTYTDKYLSVKAQYEISNIVNRIIEEEGGSEFIVQATFPRAGSMSEVDNAKYDFGEEFDLNSFIREVPIRDVETSLIYLIGPEEEIDYDLIFRISQKMHKLIKGGDDEHIRLLEFVFFYEIKEQEKELISNMFKNDMITERYFIEETKKISDIYVNMYKTRTDTEGYIYLDLYANKKDEVMKIFSEPNEDNTVKFIERYKKEGINK